MVSDTVIKMYTNIGRAKRVFAFQFQVLIVNIFIICDKAPSQEPGNIRVSIQQETSLTFQWDPIECGSRGADRILYEYSINTSPSRSGTISGTLHTEQNLDPCSTFEFRVKAVNVAGDGPETSITTSTKEKGRLIYLENTDQSFPFFFHNNL